MAEVITAPDVAMVIGSIAVVGGVLLGIKVAKKGWREVISFFN